ncbi:MAG: sulfurtransferase TusA family protein [Desulfobulbaceae bacterium]|nr:sulfurtransferase TusA family protein [Desulfobulbaceae bacterium]
MSGQVAVDLTLDIKGEVCPYTFVKTKLAMESLSAGQVLKIILDHDPASVNVPKSLRGEGHEVLEVSKDESGDWVIIARKKG